MTVLVSLSLSIGILAGVLTFLFLSPFTGAILAWAAFVAWACFYHSGADTAALKSTIICTTFGVFCGWVTAIVILALPLAGTLGLPLWAGICVGVAVILLVLAAHIPVLSVIPASVYGYACSFAFLLQTPDALSLDAMLSVGLGNVMIAVPISMAIGAFFGIASSKIGNAIAATPAE